MADLVPLIKLSLISLSNGVLPPTMVIKSLLAKAVGYAIICGSTMIKVPQITNVLRARSAEGLSATAFELESWALVVHAGYGWVTGLPFSSYGEAALMLCQNLLLLALVYRYARMPAARAAAVMGVLVGAVAVLASGRVTRSQIGALYDVNNFVMLAARVPQVVKNYRDKSTGQLSIVTYGIGAAGCLIRILTSLHDGALAMVRSYMLGMAMNSTLVGQILYYGNKGVAKAPAGAAAKAKKKA
ncbi:MAG: hypothetical protein J3K34DRAFT_403171 [Monoraphidium minutum]|nr:MAG: hypothetical protein J3K34DRAFT_403171 [Monoraphidium minutum]